MRAYIGGIGGDSPYRDSGPKPAKLPRMRARIRGFIRRILLPTLFVCGAGAGWAACCIQRESRLTEKAAALAATPVTVPVSTALAAVPEPPKPPPPMEGMFYETTSAFNGLEISRIYDSKTRTTCYVVNDQRRDYDNHNVAPGVSCIQVPIRPRDSDK